MTVSDRQAMRPAPVLPWDAEGASGRAAMLAGIIAQVPESLIAAADRALHVAKSRGRNCVASDDR